MSELLLDFSPLELPEHGSETHTLSIAEAPRSDRLVESSASEIAILGVLGTIAVGLAWLNNRKKSEKHQDTYTQ